MPGCESQCYPGPGNLSPSTDTRMLTCRCTSCPGLSNTPAVPLTRFLKCDRLQPHLEPPSTPCLGWPCKLPTRPPDRAGFHHPSARTCSMITTLRSSRPILSSAMLQELQCCLCLPDLPDLRALVGDISIRDLYCWVETAILCLPCSLARPRSFFHVLPKPTSLYCMPVVKIDCHGTVLGNARFTCRQYRLQEMLGLTPQQKPTASDPGDGHWPLLLSCLGFAHFLSLLCYITSTCEHLRSCQRYSRSTSPR